MFNNPGAPSKPTNAAALQGRNPLKSFADSMTRATATQRPGLSEYLCPQAKVNRSLKSSSDQSVGSSARSSTSHAGLDQRLAGHMAGGPTAASMDSSFMNIDQPMMESSKVTPPGPGNWAQEFDGSKMNHARPTAAQRGPREAPTVSMPHQQQQFQHSMPPQFYHTGMPAAPMYHRPMVQQPIVASENKPAADVKREGAVDMEAAKRMVETMRASGNAKFANSQFVDFVDQIVKGDLQLSDDKVLDSTGQPVDWEVLYDEAAAAMAHAEEIAEEQEEMSRRGENSGVFGPMDDVWQQLQQEGWLLQEGWTSARDTYEFISENPYLESSESPLQLALRLMAEGKDKEAMLALEAEVQQHPDSSEGWRLLGLMHAANDMDVEAITCLEKGHDADPYNTDSLLALGVSLTNELDSYRALKILREWLQNHETYHGLVQASTVDPQMLLDYDFLKKDVVSLLEKATQSRPQDSDAFIALGVAHNIDRNYSKAVESFITAATLRPEDPSLWNKLGATLANSGHSEASLVAYNQWRLDQKATAVVKMKCRMRRGRVTALKEIAEAVHLALSLKPNYARAWSNLAIAHCNLNQHEDGIRFYLAALKLSPKAEHLWTLLFNAVAAWAPDRDELGDMVDRHDMAGLNAAVGGGVPDVENLPAPQRNLAQGVGDVVASLRAQMKRPRDES